MAVISTLFVNSTRPARSAPTRSIEPFPQPTSDGEPSISSPAELPSRLPDGGLEVRDGYMTLTITENGSTCVTLVALGNTDCCEPAPATVEASTTTSAPPPASSSGDSANTALIIFGVTFGIADLAHRRRLAHRRLAIFPVAAIFVALPSSLCRGHRDHQAHLAPLEMLDLKDPRDVEGRQGWGQQVHRDRLAPMVQQVHKVLLVRPVLLVLLEQQVPKVLQVPKAPLDLRVLLVLLEQPVLKVLRAPKVLLARRVLLVLMDHQVLQALQAPLDQPALLVLPDQPVPKVPQDLEDIQVHKDNKARLAMVGPRGLRDLLGLKGLKDIRDIWDLTGLPVPMAREVDQGHAGAMGFLDPKVHEASMVIEVRQDQPDRAAVMVFQGLLARGGDEEVEVAEAAEVVNTHTVDVVTVADPSVEVAVLASAVVTIHAEDIVVANVVVVTE
ncbi:hypothetical protein ABKA04_005106 [Annulohypoxylon sp. FPYF3050]